MKKILKILLTTFLIFCTSKFSVKADGAILPPDEIYYMYETTQNAFIIYDDGHEDLVISISFSGNASDFGWIIPLPNKPEISKVDYSIFRKLSEETEPKQNLLDKIKGESGYYYTSGLMESAPASKNLAADETSVQVIEEESIGIYDYAILTADDPGDLKEWMEENGYRLPTGSDFEDYDEYNPFSTEYKSQSELWSDALPIIKDYIDSGWYFVTVKVNNEYTDSSGVQSQLGEGAVDPLRFSFDTTDMIYPMKLTSISRRSISVNIYIIDDHKVYVSNYDTDYCSSSNEEECSRFSTSYASKIEKENISEITKEVGKGSWYEAESDMYITELYSNYLSYEYMDEDVLFSDSKNNQGVNDGSMRLGEWIQLPFVLIIYLPYLILGGIFTLFEGTSYYYWYGLEAAWFIGISIAFFVLSIVWIIVSRVLLKKTKKKLIRILLYSLQFPAIWFASLCSSLLIVIPIGIGISILVSDEGVVLLDGFCCLTFLMTLLPVILYRIWWRKKNRN